MIMEGWQGAVETQQVISDYTGVNRSGVLNLLGDDFTAGRCHESGAVKNPRTFDLGWLRKVTPGRI